MTGNKIILEDLEYISKGLNNLNKLSGKVVLISGANGFLPAYIVESILFLQAKNIIENVKILALVRNISKAKLRFKDYLENKSLIFLEQDVCIPLNYKEKVNFIIHAASQASPKYYGTDPIGTLSANVIGTINMLEFAQKQSVESFLYFSSSEVYGVVDESQMPIKESNFGYLDPINVRSCYAESKRMGENICIAFMHQHHIPVKIVRPFHTYGPGMMLNDGRVYADFISDIVNNRNIVMKSDGLAQRAFCYLSDATIAFLLVLLKGEEGQPYNVGNPNCEISIVNLAQLLVDLFPSKMIKLQRIENISNNYIHSKVNRNLPDIEKIKSLGWIPKISINEGFYRTILSYE